MEAPLFAFREITIPVDIGTEIMEIKVPFTVELLRRVEDTILLAQDRGFMWFRIKRSDKTVLAAYEEFCRPYLPASLDLMKVQPTFTALFFSAVKRELLTSIGDFEKSMTSTAT